MEVRDDDFYLNADEFKTKRSFSWIGEKIFGRINSLSGLSVLDVGCGNGSFINYLVGTGADSICGIDVNDKLLSLAASKVPGAVFKGHSIEEKDLARKLGSDWDVITMLGVHSIFDEVDTWVKNLCELVADSGVVFVFGSFNPEDIDVLVRLRKPEQDSLHLGFNRISLRTCVNEFSRYGFSVHADQFLIDEKLEKQLDPTRSFTQVIDSKLTLRNGLEQFCSQYLLTIERSR